MGSLVVAQSQVLERIARGTSLRDLLESIVLLIESQAEGMLCSILLLDAAQQTLHHGAAPSLPASYVAALDGSAIGPEAGSCGSAAARNEPVFVEDIATHPYWAPYKHLALPHGLHACWSTPIHAAGGEVLGTFAMYYRTPRMPNAQELEWVTTATQLASIAISRARATEDAQRSQTLTQALVRSLAEQVGELRRAQEALGKREERLRVLNELGEALRASSDPDQVLPVALRLIGQHMQVARCAYADVATDGVRVVVPHDYADGCPSMVGEHLLSSVPLVAEALGAGATSIVIRDVATEMTPEGGGDALRELGSQAFICCAHFREGTLRALLAVHHREPRDWTEDEVQLLHEMVERCWVTIEQRASDARLRQSEALLRIAGRAAKLGGWSYEIVSARVVWSDEVCAIHEMPTATSPSLEDAVAFYAPDSRERLRASLRACEQQAEPYDFEAQLVLGGGRRKWVRVIGYPERDSSGTVVRVQGALQDIDERRRMEEQLLHSQKMEAIGQLAGGVAHDFNNLLTVILSYASLALTRCTPNDPLRTDLEEIVTAGRRAAELTQQLLAFSRKQLLEPRVVDLNQSVAAMEKMLGRLVGDDVGISLHTAAVHAKVFADPAQLEQVLMNLVVNARDAMPNGGSVSIALANVELDEEHALALHGVAPGPYVELTVADTGTGIDEETRSRIFDPFFTTKERGKGTGLGLSTVWGIVTQSGGAITVTSELGSGASFHVYLPRVESELSGRSLEPAPALGGTETVLLVEDDDQVRGVVLGVLRRAGYHVLDARNAGEAFLICEQHRGTIDLLLTDVVMPRLNGRELAERLRPMRPGMGVLYVSGYTETRLHDGAPNPRVAFLAKPITPDVLLRKVRDVLDACRSGHASL